MKIAILILCHKNPKQINLLLDKLNHQDIDCYIHIVILSISVDR